MASHYGNVSYGSNENVITGPAKAVQATPLPTDKRPFPSLTSFAWEMMNHGARRKEGACWREGE